MNPQTQAPDERDSLRQRLGRIIDKAEGEGRDLHPDEAAKFDRLEAKLTELEETRAPDPARRLLREGGSGRVERTGLNAPGGWLAHELRTLSGAAGLGQAITPVESANYVLDHLAAQSVGLVSGFTRLTTERDTLDIPHTTGDGTASWTAENALITTTDVTGETITAVPRKLAALQITSNEVLQDSFPPVLNVLQSRLIRAMANRLDLGFFEGSGAAPEIRGLRNVTGIQTVDMGANGSALASLDPFADAIGLLEQENANATAVVMHPRTWKSLLKLKEAPTGNNKPLLQESAGSGSQDVQRRLYGVAVYLSSQVSIAEAKGTATNASSAYVYEAARIYAVARQEVRVEVDRGGQYFERDQAAVRAISRHDMVVPDPEVVVRITGIIP